MYFVKFRNITKYKGMLVIRKMVENNRLGIAEKVIIKVKRKIAK
jgi:hypothetical protein